MMPECDFIAVNGNTALAKDMPCCILVKKRNNKMKGNAGGTGIKSKKTENNNLRSPGVTPTITEKSMTSSRSSMYHRILLPLCSVQFLNVLKNTLFCSFFVKLLFASQLDFVSVACVSLILALAMGLPALIFFGFGFLSGVNLIVCFLTTAILASSTFPLLHQKGSNRTVAPSHTICCIRQQAQSHRRDVRYRPAARRPYRSTWQCSPCRPPYPEPDAESAWFRPRSTPSPQSDPS